MNDLARKINTFLKLKFKRFMSTYPLTTNHFRVEWGTDSGIAFTEVCGLSIEIEPINYKIGNFKSNTPVKMPGRIKYNNVILKRGIVRSDNDFYNWFNTINLNTIERRTIVIRLLNEEHIPVIVWELKNAFPIKVEWSNLIANANEPAIESIEIAHEGMTVQND